MTVKMKSQAFLQTSSNTLTSNRGQKHQINATIPLFKIKSNEQREHPRTEYVSIDKGNQSLQSAKANSINRSNERHQLKPCQVPKALPDTTEFSWSRADNNSFGMEESSIKGRMSSKADQHEIYLMSRQLSEKNSYETQQAKEEQICCPEVNILSKELSSKWQQLTNRMHKIEQRNKYLKESIQQSNTKNKHKMSNVGKLMEQRDDLLLAKEKWEKGRAQLQHLLVEVTAKIQRQRQQQKENMGKEDCQSYFRERSIEKTRQKPPISRAEAKSKGSMLQRLRVRVQKN